MLNPVDMEDVDVAEAGVEAGVVLDGLIPTQ